MIKIGLVLVSILIISPLTVQAYALNITAFVHMNEEAIKEDNDFGNLEDAWYTVDGKNYSGWYYDMDEAVYPYHNDDINYDMIIEKELTVPDNTTEICFENNTSPELEYKTCSNIKNTRCSMIACEQIPSDVTEIHFSYPASWEKED
jgi:hypothetical protein